MSNYLIVDSTEGLRWQSPIASDIGAQFHYGNLDGLVTQIDQWALTAQVGDLFTVGEFLVVRLNEDAILP